MQRRWHGSLSSLLAFSCDRGSAAPPCSAAAIAKRGKELRDREGYLRNMWYAAGEPEGRQSWRRCASCACPAPASVPTLRCGLCTVLSAARIRPSRSLQPRREGQAGEDPAVRPRDGPVPRRGRRCARHRQRLPPQVAPLQGRAAEGRRCAWPCTFRPALQLCSRNTALFLAQGRPAQRGLGREEGRQELRGVQVPWLGAGPGRQDPGCAGERCAPCPCVGWHAAARLL